MRPESFQPFFLEERDEVGPHAVGRAKSSADHDFSPAARVTGASVLLESGKEGADV